MIVIGCDYHSSWQQISWVDTETGETEERSLEHASGEAERFYRQLGGATEPPGTAFDDATGRGADYFAGVRADPGRCVAVSARKQVASYLGLIPREYSSGGHQRFGSISKQGNRFMRMLLVEAAQVAVRCDPQLRNEYLHRCHRKAKGVAKVAAARKLAIRLYWMLRTQKPYPEIVRIESRSRVPLVSAS